VGSQIEFGNFHVRPIKDSVLGRIDDFIVGALIAHLYVSGHLARLPKYTGAAGLIFFAATLALADISTFGILPSWSIAFVNNAAQLSFGLLLCTALRSGSLIARALSIWPMTLIGAMCFSLYTWHIIFRSSDFIKDPLDLSNTAIFFLPFFITSFITYRYVEFPRESWQWVLRLRIPQEKPQREHVASDRTTV
jgi:peptidoglycan/LPS O-acetylase OafA/YrhL